MAPASILRTRAYERLPRQGFDVHDPDSGDPQARKREQDAARQAGIEVVTVSTILAASPDRRRFSCLDHIHMTEPYHRLMAKRWLRAIWKEPLTADAR